MPTPAKQQRRYSPEVRRSMILDTAARIIVDQGVAGLSMEQISRGAGISKSLMYKYFDNLNDLLSELLHRELKGLRRQEIKAAESATTFEELVRNITHEYLKYIGERGMVIQRLQSEPSISDMHDPTDYGRTSSIDYFAPIVSNHFGLPLDVARALTDISYGIPAAAGEFLLKGEMPIEEVEDLTVSMIIGTFVMARNDYITRNQKLPRLRVQDLTED